MRLRALGGHEIQWRSCRDARAGVDPETLRWFKSTSKGAEGWGSVAVFSAGLARLDALQLLLGAESLRFRPSARSAAELEAVAGWGHKPTARVAREYSRRHDLPYLALEDGFLRSVGLGGAEPPLSLIVDEVGIYYDARSLRAWSNC